MVRKKSIYYVILLCFSCMGSVCAGQRKKNQPKRSCAETSSASNNQKATQAMAQKSLDNHSKHALLSTQNHMLPSVGTWLMVHLKQQAEQAEEVFVKSNNYYTLPIISKSSPVAISFKRKLQNLQDLIEIIAKKTVRKSTKKDAEDKVKLIMDTEIFSFTNTAEIYGEEKPMITKKLLTSEEDQQNQPLNKQE